MRTTGRRRSRWRSSFQARPFSSPPGSTIGCRRATGARRSALGRRRARAPRACVGAAFASAACRHSPSARETANGAHTATRATASTARPRGRGARRTTRDQPDPGRARSRWPRARRGSGAPPGSPARSPTTVGSGPCRRDEGERGHGAIAGAPAEGQAAQRADPHRRRRDRARAAQELERGIARPLQADRLGADAGQMEGVQQISRPQPVGHDPQGEHGRDAECERPPATLGQRDVDGVRRDEEPHLGTRQPRQRAEHERRAAAAAQVQLDRAEHERHDQRLDVARRQVAQPVGAGEERDRRDHPGDRAAGARPEPEGQRQRREARGPHDHEPEARRRGAGRAPAAR